MNLPPTSRLLFPHQPGPRCPRYDHHSRLRRKSLLNALLSIGREDNDSAVTLKQPSFPDAPGTQLSIESHRDSSNTD